jgi:hypothetical protein
VLLTAQRVLSPALRQHGVNVYKYMHEYEWSDRVPDQFLPHNNAGVLIGEWEQLRGGGNQVVSYLDLVVPDDIEPLDLHQRLASLKYRLRTNTQPAVAYWDYCWASFGTATKIPPQTEVGALAGTILLRLTGH